MKPAIILFAGALLAAATPACAESWRMVGEGGEAPERAAYLVDTDTISRSGETVTFRSMTVWESYGDDSDFNKSITERRGNCSSKSGTIVSNSYYADGTRVGTEAGSDTMTTFGANSLMRSVLDAVCGEASYESDRLNDPEGWIRSYFANS